jgi:hypothetical protein
MLTMQGDIIHVILWALVVGFFAGFGWGAGTWLAARVTARLG